MIFAHDTSRVIQCLIKYGTQEHKNAIFEELKGMFQTQSLCLFSAYPINFSRGNYLEIMKHDHLLNSDCFLFQAMLLKCANPNMRSSL